MGEFVGKVGNCPACGNAVLRTMTHCLYCSASLHNMKWRDEPEPSYIGVLLVVLCLAGLLLCCGLGTSIV